ncbi:MAG: hypothetical protein IPO92_03710 [Saprospiraceae bacterium]|nr:hypothetical protein [Saprospiraceae bacterium]
MKCAIVNVHNIHSTRAMAFIIKGLYYSNVNSEFASDMGIVRELADRMVQMYAHESDDTWLWFESYMTYGNRYLPEAMLCSWLVTGTINIKILQNCPFDFL